MQNTCIIIRLCKAYLLVRYLCGYLSGYLSWYSAIGYVYHSGGDGGGGDGGDGANCMWDAAR